MHVVSRWVTSGCFGLKHHCPWLTYWLGSCDDLYVVRGGCSLLLWDIHQTNKYIFQLTDLWTLCYPIFPMVITHYPLLYPVLITHQNIVSKYIAYLTRFASETQLLCELLCELCGWDLSISVSSHLLPSVPSVFLVPLLSGVDLSGQSI